MNCQKRVCLNRCKGYCQGRKGQIWPLFTYLSMLFSIAANCLAPNVHGIVCTFILSILWTNVHVSWMQIHAKSIHTLSMAIVLHRLFITYVSGASLFHQASAISRNGPCDYPDKLNLNLRGCIYFIAAIIIITTTFGQPFILIGANNDQI